MLHYRFQRHEKLEISKGKLIHSAPQPSDCALSFASSSWRSILTKNVKRILLMLKISDEKHKIILTFKIWSNKLSQRTNSVISKCSHRFFNYSGFDNSRLAIETLLKNFHSRLPYPRSRKEIMSPGHNLLSPKKPKTAQDSQHYHIQYNNKFSQNQT